ncbi:MAG: hypothetical protein JXM70_23195 [Pirellulales bacterium]|nr:hypothetical protein [Pirellulales bacterium]
MLQQVAEQKYRAFVGKLWASQGTHEHRDPELTETIHISHADCVDAFLRTQPDCAPFRDHLINMFADIHSLQSLPFSKEAWAKLQ